MRSFIKEKKSKLTIIIYIKTCFVKKKKVEFAESRYYYDRNISRMEPTNLFTIRAHANTHQLKLNVIMLTSNPPFGQTSYVLSDQRDKISYRSKMAKKYSLVVMLFAKIISRVSRGSSCKTIPRPRRKLYRDTCNGKRCVCICSLAMYTQS